MIGPLQHPLLLGAGVSHGFGLRGLAPPPALLLPQQIHGNVVAAANPAGVLQPRQADAVVSNIPGLSIGIVTADCVPILAAHAEGHAVVAIHAGWRGLAAGVVAAGVEALRAQAGTGGLRAVIGPHIGPCCYEVDDPVVEALRQRFGRTLSAALRPSRPGHVWLDLGSLVDAELAGLGLGAKDRARVPEACTCCQPKRFHSFRRDGAAAGRMLHHITSRCT